MDKLKAAEAKRAQERSSQEAIRQSRLPKGGGRRKQALSEIDKILIGTGGMAHRLRRPSKIERAKRRGSTFG